MDASITSLLAPEPVEDTTFILSGSPSLDTEPAVTPFSALLSRYVAPAPANFVPFEFQVPSPQREQAQAVIAKARKQSLFGYGTDQNWMEDPSHKAIELFAAEQIGFKTRDYGGVLELTHPYETANGVINWNIPALASYPRDVVTYVVFSHDFLEILRRKKSITSQRIVDATWRGDPQVKSYLRAGFEFFTDDPEKRGALRLIAQIEKAIQSGDQLFIHGRLADKTFTYIRDLWSIKFGLMTFANKDDAADYIDNRLLPREWMVRQLPVDKRYKRDFVDLRDEILRSITEQFAVRRRRGIGPDERKATDYKPDRREAESRIKQLIRLGGEAPAA